MEELRTKQLTEEDQYRLCEHFEQEQAQANKALRDAQKREEDLKAEVDEQGEAYMRDHADDGEEIEGIPSECATRKFISEPQCRTHDPDGCGRVPETLWHHAHRGTDGPPCGRYTGACGSGGDAGPLGQCQSVRM